MTQTNRCYFDTTSAGEQVELLTLNNGEISCEILTFGAILRSLWVPDRSGKAVDVVLGCDSVGDYLASPDYMGAIVGRYANRISEGRFYLGGKICQLSLNSGVNHIHGGFRGFSHKVWEVERLTATRAVLSLDSPDGEEGYPGNLYARVTYALKDRTLSIRYEAQSDRDTVCNLTNHAYFNLAGHDSGTMLDQELSIQANHYLPTDPEGMPMGPAEPVWGTPMDLREPVPIGSRIQEPYFQLKQSNGFDHSYVLNGRHGTLRPAAQASSPVTGITMTMETTLPGIQLYTANFLEEGRQGKNGACYGPRHAFCLETQFFPDSPNRPDFPASVLRAGGIYDHLTRYQF